MFYFYCFTACVIQENRRKKAPLFSFYNDVSPFTVQGLPVMRLNQRVDEIIFANRTALWPFLQILTKPLLVCLSYFCIQNCFYPVIFFKTFTLGHIKGLSLRFDFVFLLNLQLTLIFINFIISYN